MHMCCCTAPSSYRTRSVLRQLSQHFTIRCHCYLYVMIIAMLTEREECMDASLTLFVLLLLLLLQWIATTIVKPLTNEINVINSALNKKGRSEQIGSKWRSHIIISPHVGMLCVCVYTNNIVCYLNYIFTAVALDVLKRLNNQATPTLPMVIQYLDLTPKQEYLVERIKGKWLSG